MKTKNFFMLLLLALCAAVYADGEDIIVNGDFESALDSTWSVVVDGDAEATIASYEEIPSWTTEVKNRLGVYVTAVDATPEFTDVYVINNNAYYYNAGDSCYLTYYARTEVGGQQIQPMLVSYDAVDGQLTTVIFETRTLESANNGMKTVSAIVDQEGTYQFAIACGMATGTYVIDNVLMYYYDRSPLSLAIAEAQATYETCIISPLYGYSEESYLTLKEVCEAAEEFKSQTGYTEAESDSVVSLIEASVESFNASYKDEVVLRAYSGYDFSGEEYGIHCGYYNGDLDTLDDKIVSFKLEKGYMATFAQDEDGLGYSKVYIAQDYALELNLPAELQYSISFIRVSPWYEVGKKGSLGKIDWSTEENLNAEWYYNWGLGVPYQNSGYSTPEVQYAPMSWSKGDYWTSTDKMEYIGQNMALNNHLAFNEPDNEGQSNLTVAEALEAYPKLLASGLRLGAPGVENVQYSANNDSFNTDAWIKEFMDSCVARGYRVDFIPAHDYVRRTTATYLERFKALYDRYGIPVWVTEYNYGNPNMGSADIDLSTGYAKIKAMTDAFEDAEWIERYNWYFFFGESSGIGAYDSDGELNITGEYYRDLESPAPSYIQEVYEDGPYVEPSLEDENGQINYYVASSGDDVNNDGLSEASPFASISAAFSAISAYYADHSSCDDYVVNLGTGTFTEQDLEVANSGAELFVTLKGEGADKSIIQGATALSDTNIQLFTTPSAYLQYTLEDVTVQNYGASSGGSHGIISMDQKWNYFTANRCVFKDIKGADGALFKTNHAVYMYFNECSFLDINGEEDPIINMGRGYVYVRNCVFNNCVRDYSGASDDNANGIIIHSQTAPNWATAAVELINNTFVECGVINGDALTTIDDAQSLIKAVWNFEENSSNAVLNINVANNLFCGNALEGMTSANYYDITVVDESTNANLVVYADSTNNIFSAVSGFPTTGNTINPDLSYTSPELDFTMDGDAPELFTTSTGVVYVKAKGSLVINGGLAAAATTYDITGAERAATPSVGAYEAFEEEVTANIDADVSSESVQFYPNPVVGGELNIDYGQLDVKDARVSLYNLRGQLIHAQAGTPQVIDVADYPSGLYLLQISTTDGSFNYKIMVDN